MGVESKICLLFSGTEIGCGAYFVRPAILRWASSLRLLAKLPSQMPNAADFYRQPSLLSGYCAVIVTCATWLPSPDACAGFSFQFEETAFGAGAWSTTPFWTGGAPSSSATLAEVGQGLTGNALRVANFISPGASNLQSVVLFGASEFVGSSPISSLEMSIAALSSSPQSQLYGFAVAQGGQVWTTNTIAWLTSQPGFVTRSVSLVASDFQRPFAVDPASQSTNPNFGLGALPITFGFYVFNSSPIGTASRATEALYSNFSVSVVPGPGVLAALLASTAASGCSPRRRKRR
jgi:hypothetical protein